VLCFNENLHAECLILPAFHLGVAVAVISWPKRLTKCSKDAKTYTQIKEIRTFGNKINPNYVCQMKQTFQKPNNI